MPPRTIAYFAERFAQIGGEEILPAYELARKAQESWEKIERSSIAEHALYLRLWGVVSQVLDHGNYLPIHEDMLNVLESELAGRTLTIRMSLGWIERSASGPMEFPALEDFLN